MTMLDPSRRQVLKGSAAAIAMGAIGSLGALHARQAHAAGDRDTTLTGPESLWPSRAGRG